MNFDDHDWQFEVLDHDDEIRWNGQTCFQTSGVAQPKSPNWGPTYANKLDHDDQSLTADPRSIIIGAVEIGREIKE